MSNVPFRNQNNRNTLRQDGTGTLDDLIINGDLSCNGTLFYNEAIVSKSKTIKILGANFEINKILTKLADRGILI